MATKQIINLTRQSNENFYCAVYYAPKQQTFQYCVSYNYKPITFEDDLKKYMYQYLKEKLEKYNQLTFIINIKNHDILENEQLFHSLLIEPICENIIEKNNHIN